MEQYASGDVVKVVPSDWLRRNKPVLIGKIGVVADVRPGHVAVRFIDNYGDGDGPCAVTLMATEVARCDMEERTFKILTMDHMISWRGVCPHTLRRRVKEGKEAQPFDRGRPWKWYLSDVLEYDQKRRAGYKPGK